MSRILNILPNLLFLTVIAFHLLFLSSCGKTRKDGWTDDKYNASKNAAYVGCIKNASSSQCEVISTCMIDYLSMTYTYSYIITNYKLAIEMMIDSGVLNSCTENVKK